jgi:thiamine-phosphate pyrophosphorylase
VNARVILITDPSFGDDAILRCVREVAAALPAGALCVQLRDKQRLPVSLRLFAMALRRATRDAGAALVINGHATLARDVGADGVHLGGGGGSVEAARAQFRGCAWVSVAAHSDDDVRRAVDAGADAVLVSPIFPTRTRSLGSSIQSIEKTTRGTNALRSARSLAGSRVAVYALGGVTVDTARACVAAGADGVAVIRALLASRSPAAAARAIIGAIAHAHNHKHNHKKE